MKRIFFKANTLILLFIYLFSMNCSASTAPQSIEKCYTGIEIDTDTVDALSKDVKVSGRIFELFFGKKESEDILLYPGGSVFGLVIDEVGVCVTAGSTSRVLLLGDRIISINGKEVNECADVECAVKESGGKRLEIDIIRSGEKMTLSVTPRLENGEYKLGVNLRSHTAGIGTLTFIEPESLSFGGLGHGVSDADGVGYVTVKSGRVTPVTLGGCKRGEIGQAGELTGVLRQSLIGELHENNECGVFGKLNELPDYCGEPIPAAKKSEVKAGSAQIISTVKNGKRMTYDIEIKDIDYSSDGSKSFKIKVTDPTLIALTGGIVRGMSGSPIIQNGKLVGAVTHVLVANPTEGYGIFIENMLHSARPQAQQKAAQANS